MKKNYIFFLIIPFLAFGEIKTEKEILNELFIYIDSEIYEITELELFGIAKADYANGMRDAYYNIWEVLCDMSKEMDTD